MDTSRFESIQQTQRHPTRTSDAYRFVSTRVVLGAFAELGWFPVTVQEARVRKPENRGFQQHLVKLRSPRASANPGQAWQSGLTFLRVIVCLSFSVASSLVGAHGE